MDADRGNAFAQEQLAIQGPNARSTDQGLVDPEVDRGRLCPGGTWNPSHILANLSQVDDTQTETIYDGSRCGPSALLAVHIQGGADSVQAVASDTLQRARGISGIDSDALANVRWLVTNHPLDGRFEHLGALQEVMYVIANATSTHNADDVDEGPNGLGTTQDEMDRLDMLGRNGDWGGLDNGGFFDRRDDSERGTHGQMAALTLPLFGGVQRGPGAVTDLIGALRNCQNVAYILGVPVPGEDPNRIGHGITLGVDGSRGIYCYDPLPREGSQLMTWPDDRAEIEVYLAHQWTIMDRVASAEGGHADPRG